MLQVSSLGDFGRLLLSLGAEMTDLAIIEF